MANLRFPVMADISYDPGVRKPDRGGEFTPRHLIARSLKFEKRKAALQRAVEFEVVPRLLMARQPAHQSDQQIETLAPLCETVEVLAGLVLGKQKCAAAGYIQSLIAQNISLEDIFLQWIEPVACRLQQMWTNDERDFADVALGLWRLQHLLREFSSAFRKNAAKSTGLSVLLTLGPGPKHELPYQMFKLVLLGEFFRRDGWSTWIEPESAGDDITALIRSEWFDVVELYVSNERSLETLAAGIKAIRCESLNRSILVAIGGPSVSRDANLVTILGGDMLAADIAGTTTRKQYLLETPKGRIE
jgi:hypothetical protein